MVRIYGSLGKFPQNCSALAGLLRVGSSGNILELEPKGPKVPII